MQEFYLLLLVSDTPDSLEDCRLSCLLEDGEMSTAAAVDVTAARICCGGRLVVIKPSMVSSTSPLSSSPSSHVRSGKGEEGKIS